MKVRNALWVTAIIAVGIILGTRAHDLAQPGITTSGASSDRGSAAAGERHARSDLLQRVAPASHPHSSVAPLHLDSPDAASDEDRLAWARAALSAGGRGPKQDAFDLLTRLAPVEAMAFLRTVAKPAELDDLGAQLVNMGVLALAGSPDILLGSDLHYFFHLGDPQLQKVTALVLGERGDESLAIRYVAMRSGSIGNPDRDERRRALEDVASVGRHAALPHIAGSLRDPDADMRIQALVLLATYGSNADAYAAEMLLSDPDARVREQAGYAIDSLWKKGSARAVSAEWRIAAPRSPEAAFGAVMDEGSSGN